MISLNFDFLKDRVSETIVGYDVDCYRLFSYFKTLYSDCYFFESLSIPRHQDRFFSLGFGPAAVFAVKGQTIRMTGSAGMIQQITGVADQSSLVIETDNPYQYLKGQCHFNKQTKGNAGGLIGYFTHEAVNYFEPSLQLKEHADFSTFKLGLYVDSLVYDTTTGTLRYYTLGEDRSDLVAQLITDAQHFEIPQSLEDARFLGHSETKAEFVEAIRRTKDKIVKGFSFQAEVGFKSYYALRGDKNAIYNKLRQINPSPYMFYVKFGEEELLGASPEILISAKKGVVLTTPTAGTTTRGKTPQEDIHLARELLSDPKEIAEHNMLVDLHRNDIARICQPGSVKIDDLMYIIKFSHVQHIVSNVVGTLKPNTDAFDVLACILPGGVVTGAPKLETIKIINSNENTPRGPYGGAVGRFGFNGDCDFCLPIRSIFCHGDRCYAQTSAGVVYDSVPEKEYQEVRNKLAAMEQTLNELGAKA